MIFLGVSDTVTSVASWRRSQNTAAAREAEALGWAWAYWQFDPDFAVYEMKTSSWVKPIHDALIPRSETRADVQVPVGIAR
jgi:hypothetical protein